MSAGKAIGGAIGAVALMVAAVLMLLSRGGTHPTGSPAIDTSRPTAATSRSSPRPTPTLSSPPSSVLPAASVTVHVQNGTSRAGLGHKTADKIIAAGYRVAKVDNATTHLEKSTIFYRPGSRSEALEFQKAFPAFGVLKESNSENTILRVVIGSDYP